MGPKLNIPTDRYALYAEFGIASEKGQVLETEAGNLTLIYKQLLGSEIGSVPPKTRKLFQGDIDDLNRMTLGQLLQCIRALVPFDESTLRIVDEALKERNYLAHEFFRTHNFAIFDVAGRQVMVEELKIIGGKLDLAHGLLSLLAV